MMTNRLLIPLKSTLLFCDTCEWPKQNNNMKYLMCDLRISGSHASWSVMGSVTLSTNENTVKIEYAEFWHITILGPLCLILCPCD